MDKRAFAVMLCIVMFLTMAGCRLAREDGGGLGDDRLIGMYVTTKPLDTFDIEGYLNAGADGMLSIDRGTGHAYAEVSYDDDGLPHYSFPGVEGIALIHAVGIRADGEPIHAVQADDGIFNDGMNVSVTDAGEMTEISGTVFALGPGQHIYYCNPVYQTADGRVYAAGTTGVSSDTVGGEMAQTARWTQTTTENGRTVTESLTVTVHIRVALAAETVTIAEYAADHRLISAMEFPAAALPESVSPGGETTYIVIELAAHDGQELMLRRAVYDSRDTVIAPEGDICLFRAVTLNW